jgi:hypothetical protein
MMKEKYLEFQDLMITVSFGRHIKLVADIGGDREMKTFHINCLRMYGNRIGIHIDKQEGNNFHAVKPVEFTEEPITPFMQIPPAIEVDNDSAQQLMDQLWICGLRPSEGSGSAGSLAATQDHLSDMRLIAFNKLGLGKKI